MIAPRTLIIGIVLGIVLLSGCVQQTIVVEPDTAKRTPAPSGTAGSDANMFEVVLTEWKIVPKTIRADAGKISLKVMNDGNYYHELAVQGRGLAFEVEDGVPSGEERTLELDLEAGTYSVYDPIPGNSDKGMVAQLVVS